MDRDVKSTTFAQTEAPPVTDCELVIEVVEARAARDDGMSRRASLALFGKAKLKSSGLHFRNLGMNVKIKNKKSSKSILRNCNGSFHSGTVTAIMGPSGAGKTTFLEILGQRVHIIKSKNVLISGQVGIENVLLTPSLFRQRCSFVPQHDKLWATLTPREHLAYALAFYETARLDPNRDLINRVLSQLGLTTCADTIAGGQFLKGCSGGQQRRTSIGIEIVAKPEVLLLDEPTSGLDALSALSIVNVLTYLGGKNITVALTIHQPSTYVWEAFNSVMVLSGGATTYLGPPMKYMNFVGSLGHEPDREHINPADYALALVCSDFEEAGGNAPERVQGLVDAWASHEKIALEPLQFASIRPEPHRTNIRECLLLSYRMLMALRKDPVLLYGRFALIFLFSFTLGLINGSVERKQSDVTKWLSQIGTEGTILPILSILTIPSFSLEAEVVSKEISNGSYSVAGYCVAAGIIQTAVAVVAAVCCLAPVWLITSQNESGLKGCQAFAAMAAATSVFDGVACILGFVTPHFLIGQVLDGILVIGLGMFNGMAYSLEAMPAIFRPLYWIAPQSYVNEVMCTTTFLGYDYGFCEWGGACFNKVAPNPFEEAASGRIILQAFNYKVSGFPDYAIDNVDVYKQLFVLSAYAICFRFVFYCAANTRLSA